MSDEASVELVDQLFCTCSNEDMASNGSTELQETQRRTVDVFLQYVTSENIPRARLVEPQTTGHTTKAPCTPLSKSRETHPCLVHSTSIRGNDKLSCSDDSLVATHDQSSHTEVTDGGSPLATSTPVSASLTVTDEQDYVIISQARACKSASSSCRNNDGNTTTESSSSGCKRPGSLFLDVKRPKYKRGNSSMSSGSSGKTTPAQDPPLFSPNSDLVQSYPPSNPGRWMPANKSCTGAARGKKRAAVVREVEARHNVAQLKSNPINCRGDPQKVLAKKIADRLKSIGDEIDQSDKVYQIEQFFLNSMTSSRLTWRRVQEIISLLSHLLKQLILSSPEEPHENDEKWVTFKKFWNLLINQVAPWISRSGGWGAFLRCTECLPLHGTATRHSLCLSEVQSTPLLPQCQIQTAPSSCSEPWTHTPKLSRVRRSNQTPPALSRSRTQPEFGGRNRVWSWSENGNMESNVYPSDSCAEFNEGDDEDDDSPLTGGADEEEMVFPSDPMAPIASPYIVNSPHPTHSQPEAGDYRVDSGIHSSIETLSLSVSPPHVVQFGIGGEMLTQLHHNSTSSCTSLASYSSLDPGSVESSRKNSITSQPGDRRSSITKPHPQRAGHCTRRPDVEVYDRTPTQPHSAGGAEFMYSVGVGLSAGFVFYQVKSLFNK